MNGLWELLPGSRPTMEGEGIETTVSHTWPFAPWVTLLALIVAAAVVYLVYWRERGGVRPAVKLGLATIRLSLIALTLLMMYGWLRHEHRTDLPDIVLAIDDSASMAFADHFDNSELRQLVERRIRAAGLDEGTRLNMAKSLLLRDDAALIRQFRKGYHLRVYRVGSVARQVSGDGDQLIDELRGMKAEETKSRLGEAIRAVIEGQRGRPTAAVVLLTDGITTDGKSLSEVADYARRKAVPLYLIGVGNDRAPRDVRLSDLLVDETVFVGDLLNFDVKLTSSGFQGKSVNLSLLRSDDGRVLDEKKVELPEDGATRSVRLACRADEQGEFDFVVQAEVLDDEAVKNNNRMVRHVSVRDETLKVLLVQEYPSYEFRFLKRLLSLGLSRGGNDERKAIELTTVLQEADLRHAESDATAARVFPVRRDELFQYDVLIMGDVNPSLGQSVLSNIADFVTVRGGGLVCMAGPRHMPQGYRDTPLENLFPVELDSVMNPPPEIQIDESFRAQPTALGMTSPQFQLGSDVADSLARWNGMPELFWLQEAPDLRPGARVLAQHPTRTGNTGQKLPLVCIQFVGAGKVIYHCTDETWRWSRMATGDENYARYWLQTIRYLSRSKLLGQTRAAELTSDREQYRRGEPVRLRVRFFDDRLAPAQDDGVTIVVERQGGRRRQIAVHRDSTNRGVFEGTIGNLVDGKFRAWIATPTFDGRPPSRQFTVLAPPGEQARMEMDSTDMKLAAELSAGRYLPFERAGELLDQPPTGRQVRIESLPPTPIWNSWVFAALFVALIASEWLLRKRFGML